MKSELPLVRKRGGYYCNWSVGFGLCGGSLHSYFAFPHHTDNIVLIISTEEEEGSYRCNLVVNHLIADAFVQQHSGRWHDVAVLTRYVRVFNRWLKRHDFDPTHFYARLEYE